MVLPCESTARYKYLSFHVIYGYRERKFVEEVIDDAEEYETIVQTLLERYGEAEISDAEQVSRIQAIIQTIERT